MENEDRKYYSSVFYINIVHFAIKSISYVLLYGTVEECRLLTHYTDLQIHEHTALNLSSQNHKRNLDFGEYRFCYKGQHIIFNLYFTKLISQTPNFTSPLISCLITRQSYSTVGNVIGDVTT